MASGSISLSSAKAWSGEITWSTSGDQLAVTLYMWKTDGTNKPSSGGSSASGSVYMDGTSIIDFTYAQLEYSRTKYGSTYYTTVSHGSTYNFSASISGLGNTSLSGYSLTGSGSVTISHDYSYSSTVAPTCTEQGYDIYRCTCGSADYRNYTDALGHNNIDTVIDPTCTEQGYTTHTCSRCGITLSDNDNYTNALGHLWDSGEITTEPTYTEDGVMTYTCTRCGEIRTEAIAKKVGSVHIYNGSTFDIYNIYVRGQDSSWGLYVPYIYNGSSWDLYS